jgi:tRNA pseudouridine55 synthase
VSADGVLVIDKPAGMTSHDVVDAVRARFETRKVGHAGTLDPDATGVLVLGLGKATRLLAYGQAGPKRYEAAARFGVATDTQDASGRVLRTSDVSFSRAGLEEALEGFRGDISQVPPMVSAVKMGGERLYRKARRGEEVERPARTVTVYSLDLVHFDPPDATLEVVCSAGTYVRTLIHDVGSVLGSGAHMTSLRRTGASGFTLDDAVPLEEAGAEHLRPLADAVLGLPTIVADSATAAAAAHGRRVPLPDEVAVEDRQPVALMREGRLIAVYRREGRMLTADRVVPA